MNTFFFPIENYLTLTQIPSSRRRPGSSPVVDLNNTMGWIPAFAGMTNQFDRLSRIYFILNNLNLKRD